LKKRYKQVNEVIDKLDGTELNLSKSANLYAMKRLKNNIEKAPYEVFDENVDYPVDLNNAILNYNSELESSLMNQYKIDQADYIIDSKQATKKEIEKANKVKNSSEERLEMNKNGIEKHKKIIDEEKAKIVRETQEYQELSEVAKNYDRKGHIEISHETNGEPIVRTGDTEIDNPIIEIERDKSADARKKLYSGRDKNEILDIFDGRTDIFNSYKNYVSEYNQARYGDIKSKFLTPEEFKAEYERIYSENKSDIDKIRIAKLEKEIEDIEYKNPKTDYSDTLSEIDELKTTRERDLVELKQQRKVLKTQKEGTPEYETTKSIIENLENKRADDYKLIKKYERSIDSIIKKEMKVEEKIKPLREEIEIIKGSQEGKEIEIENLERKIREEEFKLENNYDNSINRMAIDEYKRGMANGSISKANFDKVYGAIRNLEKEINENIEASKVSQEKINKYNEKITSIKESTGLDGDTLEIKYDPTQPVSEELTSQELEDTFIDETNEILEEDKIRNQKNIIKQMKLSLDNVLAKAGAITTEGGRIITINNI